MKKKALLIIILLVFSSLALAQNETKPTLPVAEDFQEFFDQLDSLQQKIVSKIYGLNDQPVSSLDQVLEELATKRTSADMIIEEYATALIKVSDAKQAKVTRLALPLSSESPSIARSLFSDYLTNYPGIFSDDELKILQLYSDGKSFQYLKKIKVNYSKLLASAFEKIRKLADELKKEAANLAVIKTDPQRFSQIEKDIATLRWTRKEDGGIRTFKEISGSRIDGRYISINPENSREAFVRIEARTKILPQLIAQEDKIKSIALQAFQVGKIDERTLKIINLSVQIEDGRYFSERKIAASLESVGVSPVGKSTVHSILVDGYKKLELIHPESLEDLIILEIIEKHPYRFDVKDRDVVRQHVREGKGFSEIAGDPKKCEILTDRYNNFIKPKAIALEETITQEIALKDQFINYWPNLTTTQKDVISRRIDLYGDGHVRATFKKIGDDLGIIEQSAQGIYRRAELKVKSLARENVPVPRVRESYPFMPIDSIRSDVRGRQRVPDRVNIGFSFKTRKGLVRLPFPQLEEPLVKTLIKKVKKAGLFQSTQSEALVLGEVVNGGLLVLPLLVEAIQESYHPLFLFLLEDRDRKYYEYKDWLSGDLYSNLFKTSKEEMNKALALMMYGYDQGLSDEDIKALVITYKNQFDDEREKLIKEHQEIRAGHFEAINDYLRKVFLGELPSEQYRRKNLKM